MRLFEGFSGFSEKGFSIRYVFFLNHMLDS